MLRRHAKRLLVGWCVAWCVSGALVSGAQSPESVERVENLGERFAGEPCPVNLRSLVPEVEKILALLSDRKFKTAMRESLTASIPEAIQRADGLDTHIAALARDIREQTSRLRYVERVAREASGNLTAPLNPCRRGEKGSYCRAVEEYHTVRALLVAQRAFLRALQCYRARGVD